MGLPQYDSKGSYVTAKDPNDHTGEPPGWYAGGWEADQKKKVQAAQDAINYRNNGLLSRMAPPLTDTSAYQDQLAASRANQLASLGLLRNSAMGQGPSYANAQSAIALGSGINQMHAPQGNALAQRNQMLAGNNALANLGAQGAQARGTEMNKSMQAYGTGAQAVRGGDLAGQQAAMGALGRAQQLQLQNARANQGMVQGFEGLDMDRALAQTKDAQEWYNLWLQKQGAQADQNMKETQAAIQTMAAAAAMASDRRIKKEVR